MYTQKFSVNGKTNFSFDSPETDPYSFNVTNHNMVNVEKGDVCYQIRPTSRTISSYRGETILSADIEEGVQNLFVRIRGYSPANRSASYDCGPNLPYINGCATEMLIHPQRPGDPTVQLLYMPPHTTEQAHHVHSTARVVYVVEGQAQCEFRHGNNNKENIHLKPGDVLILGRFTAHHFFTISQPFICLPIHIWSATPGEGQHPMKWGTVNA